MKALTSVSTKDGAGSVLDRRSESDAAHEKKEVPYSIRQPFPQSTTVYPVMRMQQALGNRAVQRLLSNRAIQAKLQISQPVNIAMAGFLGRQQDDEEENQLDAGVPPIAGAPAPAQAPNVPPGGPPVAGVPVSPTSPPEGMAPMLPEAPIGEERIAPAPPGPPPTTTGPTIGPAPPPPTDVRAQQSEAPTPENPSSGVDWGSVWETATSDDALNVARTAFEAGRLAPGVGLWSGVAADAVNTYQDLRAIPPHSAVNMEAVLVIRHLINGANNALGHILYVDQLIQDGLAGSVVGMEFVPITAIVSTIGSDGKVVLDGAQLLLDGAITIGSYAETMSANTPEDAAAWQGMLDGYQANLWTDVFTTANDLFGLATAGASQSGAIGQGTKTFIQIAKTWKWAWPAARSFLISLWNVWGSKFTADEPPVPAALARQTAGGSVGGLEGFAWEVAAAELRSLRVCYEVGDVIINAGADALAGAIDDANRVATEMLGGQEPFALIQQFTVELMADLRGKLDGLAELDALTRSGAENAAVVRSSVGDLMALVQSLQVPNVEIPQVDLGEGVLADVGEAMIGAGADVAGAGLELVVDQVRARVEDGKAALLEPLTGIQAEADSIGEYIALMGEGARIQIAGIEQFIADLESRLAEAQSVPEVIEALVNEALGVIGIDAEFSFEEIRQAWHELGPMLDEAIEYADSHGATGGATPQSESTSPADTHGASDSSEP